MIDCMNEDMDTTLESTHGEYPNASPNSIEDCLSSSSSLFVQVTACLRKSATSMPIL